MLSLIVLPLSLLGLVLITSILKYRKPILSAEYGFGQTAWFMVSTVRTFYLFLLVYNIYLLFVSFKWLYLLSAFAILVGMLIVAAKESRDLILRPVDHYFDNQRANRFKKCPFCGQSNVFYRPLVEEEAVCYYLLTKHDELVLISMYAVQDFLADTNSFTQTLKNHYTELAISQEDSIPFGDYYTPLSSDLFCCKCQNCVSAEPIEKGFVSLKSPSPVTIKASK